MALPDAGGWYPLVRQRPWMWPSMLVLCPDFMHGLRPEDLPPGYMPFVREIGDAAERLGWPCLLSPGSGWVPLRDRFLMTGQGETVHRALLACSKWAESHGMDRQRMAYLVVRLHPVAGGARAYTPAKDPPVREVFRMFDVQVSGGEVVCIHPHLDSEQITRLYGWTEMDLHRPGSDAQRVWRHLAGLAEPDRLALTGQALEAVEALHTAGERPWQLTWLATPGGFRLWQAADLRTTVLRPTCRACGPFRTRREEAYAPDPSQEPVQAKKARPSGRRSP